MFLGKKVPSSQESHLPEVLYRNYVVTIFVYLHCETLMTGSVDSVVIQLILVCDTINRLEHLKYSVCFVRI